ncbi:MAG: hypothetical protein Q9212_002519 [Teloschistes hypoglaucus]
MAMSQRPTLVIEETEKADNLPSFEVKLENTDGHDFATLWKFTIGHHDCTKEFEDFLVKQRDTIHALVGPTPTTKEEAYLALIKQQSEKVAIWQRMFLQLSSQVG